MMEYETDVVLGLGDLLGGTHLHSVPFNIAWFRSVMTINLSIYCPWCKVSR